MKISEIITDKYKLRMPPTVYYELLADVVEVEEEQEPCEDAISRQAVLDELKKWDWQELYLPIHFKENIIDVVPSVNQQELKTGHWIYSKDINTGEIRWSECSVCGNGEIGCAKRMKYCPKCGARMEDK